MRFNRIWGVSSLVVVLSIAAICDVSAQVQRSGGGSANAQLAQQYQQAVTERAQLQADNDKLKKQLDDTKKQLDSAKQQLATTKASAGTAASELATAQASAQSSAQTLEQTKARLQELVARFRDTAVTLRDVEADRSQLQQQLLQSRAKFDLCAERNYQLYQVDSEVLDKYEHEGFFSYAARGEPFTRIKRTRIENLVDEYKERAEELRVQKSAPPAGASSREASPVQFAAPPADSAPSH